MSPRRQMSKLLFYLQRVRPMSVKWILSTLYCWTTRINDFHTFSSIVIFDLNQGSRELFERTTRGALQFIETQSRRRMKIVAKHIAFIENDKLQEPLVIWQERGVCCIDISRWPLDEHPAWAAKELSCSFVQAASFIRIWRHAIPLTQQTRNRILRVSIIEALRFARLFENETYDWDGYFEDKMNNLKRYGRAYPPMRDPWQRGLE
jgi:hypothetical protein